MLVYDCVITSMWKRIDLRKRAFRRNRAARSARRHILHPLEEAAPARFAFPELLALRRDFAEDCL